MICILSNVGVCRINAHYRGHQFWQTNLWAHLVDEELPAVLSGVHHASLLHLGTHGIAEVVLVLLHNTP